MENYNNFGDFCAELTNLKGDGSVEDNNIIDEGLKILEKEMFPFCISNTDNYQDAEDLSQTILLKAFKILYKFKEIYMKDGAEGCQKYIMGIAVKTKQQHWRDKKIFIPNPCGDSESHGVRGDWVRAEYVVSSFSTNNESDDELTIDDINEFNDNSEYKDPVGEEVEENEAIIRSYHTIIHKVFKCKKVKKNNKTVPIQLYIRILYVLSVINNYVLGELNIEKKNYTKNNDNKYCAEDIIGKSYLEVREYLKNAIKVSLSFGTPKWDYIFEDFDLEVHKKKLNDKPFLLASEKTTNESYSRLNSEFPESIYKTLNDTDKPRLL